MSTPRHIHDGGTAITNLDAKEVPRYERAILIFGDPALSIGVPMLPLRVGEGYMALHSATKQFPPNMSRFWAIYDSLKESA